ncbi:DUF3240 family protein [Lacimicrobium alkaliphilum]|uniref:DUF3240 domain-containing protein n=1 Tax=Lacimicrobium alkaliphilum TaxID=1526571 RepID=A0ABQ1RCC0_9ALTE|nr:DUF3240 family protein [Lacimicrobium alkaliphilum]GGD63722.1 hypothetical protein GCM10011357_18810 [Lacimicrobium alkaliphilum]
MESKEQILNLMLSEDLRDDVVDILICLEGISGFNLYTVDGFSLEHSQFDLTEQTEGYRRLYRLELLHAPEQLDDITRALAPLGQASSLRYWVTPVLQSGRVGQDSKTP